MHELLFFLVVVTLDSLVALSVSVSLCTTALGQAGAASRVLLLVPIVNPHLYSLPKQQPEFDLIQLVNRVLPSQQHNCKCTTKRHARIANFIIQSRASRSIAHATSHNSATSVFLYVLVLEKPKTFDRPFVA